jgi:hypothetical protein
MQLEMRGVNYDLDDALKHHIKRRLGFALRRFAARILRLTVRLTDVNGPRGGFRRLGPPGRGDGRGLGGRPLRPHRRYGETGGAVRAARAGEASSGPDPAGLRPRSCLKPMLGLTTERINGSAAKAEGGT